jgi:GT2 family glycosyltransferase
MNKNLIAILTYENFHLIPNLINEIKDIPDSDILIIDDGSAVEEMQPENIIDNPNYTLIRKEQPLGYGASFITALEYSRDLNYETIIFTNPENNSAKYDITELIQNINYGYDIVSASRLIDKFSSPEDNPLVEITEQLSENLYNFDNNIEISDPLSGVVAISFNSIKLLELTDYSHAVLLQLWIQAAHFKLTFTEIASNFEGDFGIELSEYDNPLKSMLDVKKKKKYLYPIKPVN